MTRLILTLLVMAATVSAAFAQENEVCAYAREKAADYACVQQAESPAGDEVFEQALMVGDSICESLNNYDVLPELEIVTVIGQSVHAAHLYRNVEYEGRKYSMVTLAEHLQPEKLFIMLGSNGVDYKNPVTVEQQYHELLDKMLQAVPETEIYLLSVTPVRPNAKDKYRGLIPENISAFNALLEQLAQAHGVHFVDITTSLLDAKGEYAEPGYNAGDGIHLTRNGAGKVAEAIRMQVLPE